MVGYIDCHCHLTHKSFIGKVDEVVSRAVSTGVSVIIDAGTSPADNRLIHRSDVVKAALGLYPDEATALSGAEFKQELEWIRGKEPFAVGEIGLDGTLPEFDLQKERFVEQLRLASSLGKPVIIHSRKAEKEVLEILEQEKTQRVLLHCFSGSKKLVNEAIENGYFFSIPTNVVFSTHFQELAKTVPSDRILAETDSPFLSPVKGERNEPANVVRTYEKIAELKGLDLEELKNIVYENYQRLFL
ncbi:MAG: TatD family hydrolase [Nanoarchaeota archaeon]|nr:TatD family hydrolase [Nanoarchaeota archaeon]